MSNKNYTAGPWKRPEVDPYYVMSTDGTYICICHRESSDNAERIVACVNAMEGIEDPKALRQAWDDLAFEDYYTLKEKYEALVLKMAELKKSFLLEMAALKGA